MSVRVALLGDSHLASLALAARSMDLGRLRPTFFAHILHRLKHLKVSEGCLQAGDEDLRRILKATSGGAEKIDPECYDLFVLMGLEFEFPFRCLREQFCSRAVTEQTLRDHTSRSLLFQTLGKLRQITERPVWILHNPLVDPSRCNRRPEVLTYDRFLEISGEIFRPLDAFVLPQPEETRIDDHFSLPELSRSAISLHHLTGAPDPIGQDIHHKNETFGRSVLRDLRDRLQTFPDEGRPHGSSARDPWRPRRLGTVLERDGGELLLRLGESDDGVKLNETAAAIWERCDGTRTELQLLVELRELFGAPEGDLRHGLRGALEGLVDVGALESEGAPA